MKIEPKTDSTPSSLLDGALQLARNGLLVFPLTPRSKIPFKNSKGFNDGTNDPDIIRHWWQQNPTANIGIATGKNSNIMVLDVDFRNGGDKTLAALEQQYGLLPNTVRVNTGNGIHIYFSYPSDLWDLGTVKFKSNIGSGLDIKADNGYVVGPPSVHPDGPVYQFDSDHHLENTTLAVPSQWLIDKACYVMSFESVSLQESYSQKTTIYGQTALKEEVNTIRHAPMGQQEETLNNSALKIGALVKAGEISEEDAYNSLVSAGLMMSNEPGREPWTTCIIANKVKRALQQATPRNLQQQHINDSKVQHSIHPADTSQTAPFRIKSVSDLELSQLEFPEPQFAVPGIIPEGLTILAGDPKLGKSFAAMGIGKAIATGSKVFDTIDVAQGTVLYAALEDNARRLKKRSQKLSETLGFTEHLHYATSLPSLDDGGLEALEQWMRDHPDTKLIILDTLARIKSKANGGGTAYDKDYEAMVPLQQFAITHGIGVIVITHNRKMGDDDRVKMISGSMGLSGVADALLSLQRKREEEGATLLVTGRDLEDRTINLNFDKTTCLWSILKDPEPIDISSYLPTITSLGERDKDLIMEVLDSQFRSVSLKEIIDNVGISKAMVKKHLKELVKQMKVLKVGHGQYQSIKIALSGNFGDDGNDDLETDSMIDDPEVTTI